MFVGTVSLLYVFGAGRGKYGGQPAWYVLLARHLLSRVFSVALHHVSVSTSNLCELHRVFSVECNYIFIGDPKS